MGAAGDGAGDRGDGGDGRARGPVGWPGGVRRGWCWPAGPVRRRRVAAALAAALAAAGAGVRGDRVRFGGPGRGGRAPGRIAAAARRLSAVFHAAGTGRATALEEASVAGLAGVLAAKAAVRAVPRRADRGPGAGCAPCCSPRRRRRGAAAGWGYAAAVFHTQCSLRLVIPPPHIFTDSSMVSMDATPIFILRVWRWIVISMIRWSSKMFT